MKFWNWLNGKKTVIAAILLVVSAILTQVVVGIFEVDAAWVTKVVETLNWVGGFIGTAGLGHKAVK